jgi:hypothetical protein
MAKLCNAASAFFRAHPQGRDGFHPTHRYSPLQSAAALAPFRLKSIAVVNAKQVLTGP